MSRRRFTREFKVRRKLLYQWRDELEQYGPVAFPRPGRRPADRATRLRRGEQEASRIALLERRIGGQALETDFRKKGLQRGYRGRTISVS